MTLILTEHNNMILLNGIKRLAHNMLYNNFSNLLLNIKLDQPSLSIQNVHNLFFLVEIEIQIDNIT